MGIAIFLRTEQSVNNFRKCILSVIEDKEIDYVLLTYPYIQENKPYDWKDSNGITTRHQSKYSILDNGLRRSILSRNNFEIDTISSRSNRDWREAYENFVRKLKRNIYNSKNNIEFRAFFGDKDTSKLHAKIMIGYKIINENYIPVILMLGSSNLTKPAFEKGLDFNYESDIILWDDEEYNLNLNILEGKDLKPIVCKVIEKGQEKRYLNYYNSIVSGYMDNHVEFVD